MVNMLTRAAAIGIPCFVAVSTVHAQGTPPAMFLGSPSHNGGVRAPLFEGQGGVRWRATTDGPVRSSPVIVGDRLYVGSGDGRVYALNRPTGDIVWRSVAGAPVLSSPAVSRGIVVSASADNIVFGLDARTGRMKWRVATGAPLKPTYNSAYDFFTSSPTIVGSTVIIGMADGAVYALDLTTGKQRWKFQTGGRVRATPAVDQGTVYIGSFDGRLYALDAATGTQRWMFRTVGDTIDLTKAGFDRRSIQSSAVVAQGLVFFGSRDDGLYAVDAATGEQRWRFSHRTSWVVGTPAWDSTGRVYAGSSDGAFVQAVDARTGQEVWRTRTGANVLSSPMRVGDALVVSTYRSSAPWGEVLVLDAATGTLRWKLRLDGAAISTPTGTGADLYVGTDHGSVLAIGPVSARRVTKAPRLAVYFDTTMKFRPYMDGGRIAYEHFRSSGYASLGIDSIVPFLQQRIADAVPSVVVFAGDIVPDAVTAGADTSLIRRYLEHGGKVVWLSAPVGGFIQDSTGRVRGYDPSRAARVLGVSFESFDFFEPSERLTALGRQWGLTSWLPGRFPLKADGLVKPLMTDFNGMSSSWIRQYGEARPGSGYVQLWGFGVTAERLPLIQAVAEFGLLRDAAPH